MEQQRVVALGFFDGVHRGHQAIVKKAVALAREKGMQAAVVTFENHPRAYVRGRAPDMISTFQRRSPMNHIRAARNRIVAGIKVITRIRT